MPRKLSTPVRKQQPATVRLLRGTPHSPRIVRTPDVIRMPPRR